MHLLRAILFLAITIVVMFVLSAAIALCALAMVVYDPLHRAIERFRSRRAARRRVPHAHDHD